MSASDKQIDANLQNAQKSTGPVTGRTCLCGDFKPGLRPTPAEWESVTKGTPKSNKTNPIPRLDSRPIDKIARSGWSCDGRSSDRPPCDLPAPFGRSVVGGSVFETAIAWEGEDDRFEYKPSLRTRPDGIYVKQTHWRLIHLDLRNVWERKICAVKQSQLADGTSADP